MTVDGSALVESLLLSPLFLGLIGLCVGSFLNVVIHRLPLMLERQWWSEALHQISDIDGWQRLFHGPAPSWLTQASSQVSHQLQSLPTLSLAYPPSRCPHCNHAILWFENIPLLSWLFLRGRCSECHAPISIRYPLVELGTGVLFAAVGWRFGSHPVSLLWCAVAGVLVALTAIDWDTTLLPDDLTLPLMWGGLGSALMGWTIPVSTSLMGAALGYLSLWSVYWAFKLATGKEGMGYGDFKLLAALGAWLGWQAILPILLMSSILGTIVGISLKITGQLRQERYMPFGPFLAGAGIAVMLIGLTPILHWIFP